MGTPETGWFQGTGGGIWEFSLPLTGEFAKQFERQQLVRVTGPDDPSPWVEPDPELPLEIGGEEGGKPPADDRIDPDEYTAEELRQQAADLGLPTSGTKAELAERISAKLAEPPVEGD